MPFIQSHGLYDSRFEHDACGVAMIAHIRAESSHDIIQQGLTALKRMRHRGACEETCQLGDGAGILTRLPDLLFRQDWHDLSNPLPPTGQYGVGVVFMPADQAARRQCEAQIVDAAKRLGLRTLGWRDVPVDEFGLHESARTGRPWIRQVFLAAEPADRLTETQLERSLYTLRRRLEKDVCDPDFHIPSLSCRTIVYKGLLLPGQLAAFYTDLQNPLYVSPFAMVHNRFSTNTFPSWSRAQPNRLSLHNGEINTIRGNVNAITALEGGLQSTLFADAPAVLQGVIDHHGSDSAMFDNVLELLVMSGWSLPHAMMMLIPEPWQHDLEMEPELRAFYRFHSHVMAPWDGPAAMMYSDGLGVGACLDRNGLRPLRFTLTHDNYVYAASEVGVFDIAEHRVLKKSRLGPGQMLWVDLQTQCLLLNDAIKAQVTRTRPYGEWVQRVVVDVPRLSATVCETGNSLRHHPDWSNWQQYFGLTHEVLDKVLAPMAQNGHEAISSMGYDTPLAVLSEHPRCLFDYFKQRFAQVTNPPIDAVREQRVTSVEMLLGGEGNLLAPKPDDYRKICLPSAMLTLDDVQRIANVETHGIAAASLSLLVPVARAGGAMHLEQALHALQYCAAQAVENGHTVLILDDRGVSARQVAIPSLLAVSAVHQYLIRQGLRSKTSLVVVSAEPQEVHHMAVLLGYGANAVCPYLVHALYADEQEIERYHRAIDKGLLKIMSKMGISVLQSYMGAQVFDAVGLHADVIESYFPGTASQVGGLHLDDIETDVRVRHATAYTNPPQPLRGGSDMQWRAEGEPHLYNPKTIHSLQRASRSGDMQIYREYCDSMHNETASRIALRGVLTFRQALKPIPVEEVEPEAAILQRFRSGAMSFGAISQEAHEAIAIAMNRLGACSNSGEGGEDPSRYPTLANGDSKNSAIKQVATGRFGVTSAYLVSADEIQIKIAQGAKPGEGGQLAGNKVTVEIAHTRGSTPGIELISPPPHHDIYSIEDLAELIFDLKNSNPRARISVKLVAEAGVGTIAAGVAKAKADAIVISGYDGGTGAAARSSIKHAGLPWELGLAETQQTLVLNGLRDRVVLETDGKLMSGRDVIIAALLGAETFGFSTLLLVALGCVMMRVCHLDTCPVGVATQNPLLRAKMTGTPEHVVNLLHMIALDVREHMAMLGIRRLDELIGRTDLLVADPSRAGRARKLDVTALLHAAHGPRRSMRVQMHGLDDTLDARVLLPLCRKAWERREPVKAELLIDNEDRAVGTRLGSELTRHCGPSGLPDDHIRLHFRGVAGQSFGAFVPRGITLMLEGEANDGVGKGLSGGKLVILPPWAASYSAHEQSIVGNCAFYGATGGQGYICGQAGERFAVRNSGAHLVVEGVGDHACEYMTGGVAVILGQIGKNFAAGMSGGLVYLHAPQADATWQRCQLDGMLLTPLLDLDDEDIVRVNTLLHNHLACTGSQRARELLQNWSESVGQIYRLMPAAYKRVLDATAGPRKVLMIQSI
ncbi:glutamate synthase large subunit [Paenalcaligenes niemegkensis]|uniref:glutamate synthase large subunit n=1 Tax=Paenalcaligenes niemegkensis TaxID=2895469 RepID=UPI001EE83F7B|nr:glutamate synthase large subunit [Paenalcaligenes niemegkensis]MCQ9617024.1 glutamate synthase large subunit [Paenalcaligenes niemegkensis]